MTLVTRSGDSRCFKCGSCPNCPPGLRPEGFLTTGLGAPGGFAEGGNDELEAFSPNRARSSRTSALSSAICRTKSAIMASRSTHPGQDRGSMTTAYKINPSSAAPVFQLSRMNGYKIASGLKICFHCGSGRGKISRSDLMHLRRANFLQSGFAASGLNNRGAKTGVCDGHTI